MNYVTIFEVETIFRESTMKALSGLTPWCTEYMLSPSLRPAHQAADRGRDEGLHQLPQLCAHPTGEPGQHHHPVEHHRQSHHRDRAGRVRHPLYLRPDPLLTGQVRIGGVQD